MIETATGNEELLRRGYEAFGRGDLVEVERMFSPDAVWHAQRLGALSGDHAGWPAILKFFADTMELSRGTFRLEIQEFLSNDRGAAAVVRSRAERAGRSLDSLQVHLFHVEDGAVVEIWQFADVEADRFWS
jgi:ketosteroid isomerase-like protein